MIIFLPISGRLGIEHIFRTSGASAFFRKRIRQQIFFFRLWPQLTQLKIKSYGFFPVIICIINHLFYLVAYI